MASFTFWQRWLFFVGIIISVFGALMSLLSGTLIFELFNQLINPVFWGADNIGENAKGFQQFVYGVLGATMTGWGIFMTFIAHFSFSKKEKWAWNCILVGTLAWFILDTSLSVYHKVYINAISNIAFLIMVMLPIIFTKKSFIK
jgi:hypothetical protein